VSGEMDEIGHYKYCRRMAQFANVPTLFLKNYSAHVKQTLEHVFKSGYDVIAIDSVAEILDMYKDTYKTTESAAELWFLDLQTKHKKGGNSNNKYTAFINIQQVTKAGEFAGSNRLKHMTDAMASIKREKDSDTRIVQFSKNRDCDVEQKITFRIGLNQLEYGFEMAE
jgi:predicted ATP-dependent serine protease